MILNAVESGAGAPVVLLHGLFGSARNFGAVQRQLSVRHRVIALDLRNHGDSPHAAAMDYGAMAADVLETLAARDALPAVLIGHSMGGKAAMQAALQSPDAVSRLVVVDIAPVPYPPRQHVFVQAMQSVKLAPGLTRSAADRAMAGAVPEAGVRGFLLQNLRPGEAPSWRFGLDEIAAALPAIEGWDAPPGRYEGPTLFISGRASDYIQPAYRPAIRALFPTAKFVAVKDAGHWVHADNPAGFIGVLQAFLA